MCLCTRINFIPCARKKKPRRVCSFLWSFIFFSPFHWKWVVEVLGVVVIACDYTDGKTVEANHIQLGVCVHFLMSALKIMMFVFFLNPDCSVSCLITNKITVCQLNEKTLRGSSAESDGRTSWGPPPHPPLVLHPTDYLGGSWRLVVADNYLVLFLLPHFAFEVLAAEVPEL